MQRSKHARRSRAFLPMTHSVPAVEGFPDFPRSHSAGEGSRRAPLALRLGGYQYLPDEELGARVFSRCRYLWLPGVVR